MKTIIITPEDEVRDEITTCKQLLDSDLYRLHIRKPNADETMMRNYIDQLDQRFLHKVSLHSHHHLVDEYGLGGKHFKSDQPVEVAEQVSKSFHTMEEADRETRALSYAFLSPVFDSISKAGYESAFSLSSLHSWLKSFSRFPVYALGGVRADRLVELSDAGFDGVAVLGAVWSPKDQGKRIEIAERIINA